MFSKAQRYALVVAAVACATAVSATARAHPALDDALALAGEAEFKRALAAFERAVASASLTRDELLKLLTERALVRFAVGDESGMEADLRYLAALEPQRELDERAPPQVRKKWEALRAAQRRPLKLRVRAQDVPGGVQVTAELEGAPRPPGLRVVLAARAPGGSWQTQEGSTLRYPTPKGGLLEYYGEVIGLGEVTVLNSGSREAPLTHEMAGAASHVGARHAPREGGALHDKNMKWWLIGGGGAIVIAAAVTLGVMLSGSKGSEQTMVEAPKVEL